MSVEIYTAERDGKIIVTLVGELDLPGSERAAGELDRLERREPPVLVMDLRKLDLIDSSGIQLVVSAHKRAKNAGRRLTVVRGPQQVHRVFEMMKLDEALDLVETPPG